MLALLRRWLAEGDKSYWLFEHTNSAVMHLIPLLFSYPTISTGRIENDRQIVPLKMIMIDMIGFFRLLIMLVFDPSNDNRNDFNLALLSLNDDFKYPASLCTVLLAKFNQLLSLNGAINEQFHKPGKVVTVAASELVTKLADKW